MVLDVVKGPERLPANEELQEMLRGKLHILQPDSTEVKALFKVKLISNTHIHTHQIMPNNYFKKLYLYGPLEIAYVVDFSIQLSYSYSYSLRTRKNTGTLDLLCFAILCFE